MDAASAAALRDALAGTIQRAGLFRLRVHCSTCGSLMRPSRADLAAGRPPVWETSDGFAIFCEDHHPICPGCGRRPDTMEYVEAYTGTDRGHITGRMCPDCASSLRRRIEDAVDDLEEAAADLGTEPPADQMPTFSSSGVTAWRVRDPGRRLTVR